MSALALFGVIISTAAMFIVLSGFSGLKNYSLEFISSISPELKISSVKGKNFEFNDSMKSFLEEEKVNYGLSVEDKALLSINKNSRIVKIKGVDKGFPKKNIDSIIYQGRWFNQAEDEIVVGWGIAYDLGISTMDIINPVTIYVPKPGKGQVFSEKDVMSYRKVISSGVFSLNEELNNSLIFCDLSLARSLLNLSDGLVSSIDVYSNEVSSKNIASFFGPNFNVENQIQQHETIYKMLNTEQFAIYLIFSLIVIVALFNLFGTLMMVGIEKKENLQTLIVMGASKNDVGKIFLFQGLLITFTGCFVGVFTGCILVLIQQKLSLFMITPTLAYPVVFELGNFLFVLTAVLLLGGLASALVSYYIKKSILQISQL